MWRRLKIPLTVVALAVAAGWIIHQLSGNRDLNEVRGEHFWQSLTQVRLPYLALGISLIFFSYFLRALRWREFLAPMKAAGVWNIFVATLVGFSAVAMLGRPGELVRPLLIARKEKLSLSSQFGAWTLERIFDSLTVGLMIGAALLLFPPAMRARGPAAVIAAHMKATGIMLCAGAIAAGIVLLQARRNTPLLIRMAHWLAQAAPQRLRSRLQAALSRMIENFTAGLGCIETLSRFGMCALYSALIWVPVLLTYWAICQGLGQPLSDLSWGALVVFLAAVIAGSLVQLPGVGGGPQVAAVLVLTQLFGIPLAIASSAGILLWVVCFMVVLIPGVPLAAREDLGWKRLRALVRSGSAAGSDEDAATLTVNP